MRKITALKRQLTSRHFIKFLCVGILNAGFGYGLFAALVYLNFRDEWAMLIATICGVIFNYNSVGKLVFSDRHAGSFFKFTAIYGIIYSLNISGLRVGHLIGLNSYQAAALLILPVALVSYLLNKRFVFHVEK